MSFDLDRWERWIMAVVRHPGGVEPGVRDAVELLPGSAKTLTDVVIPSPHRTAAERLGVYSNMYFRRLVDVLREEHPALEHALGDDYYDLMVQYIVAHPSRHYRLAPLGANLPQWLEHEAEDLPNHELLSDLARLERIKEEVFDAPAVPPAQLEQLEAIAPEQWADARLVTVPALRLLETRYPVNPFFQAVLDGSSPELPEPATSWVVVWRGPDWTVWRVDLSAAKHAILSCIQAGGTLGDSLTACLDLPDVDPEALMAEVGGWFRDWVADGLFSGVESPEGGQDCLV